MAAANDTASMALFCDFENIALGVRDAQYEKFDIRPVLERLLAKGSIVVKKAYCDWDRYKGFKAAMHEANFELIEIPHVRQSGKNSADIRMVVDALDLCYTKAHVDTFVIISGDSDFSPLVSKLRENAKRVIGVGVKQSCSDLLVTNCDEFIYYDDLVRDREAGRPSQRREREKRSPEEEAKRREKMEERKAKAMEIVSATFGDLMADRGEAERVWASVLKEVVKRRNPGFSESYYGFRTFGNLLDEAASRGVLAVGRDEKSGTYVTRAALRPASADAVDTLGGQENGSESAAAEMALVSPEAPPAGDLPVSEQAVAPAQEKPAARRRGGGRRGREAKKEVVLDVVTASPTIPVTPIPAAEPLADEAAVPQKPKRGGRRPRKSDNPDTAVATAPEATPAMLPEPPAEAAVQAVVEGKPEKKKPARRTPRARKPKASEGASE